MRQPFAAPLARLRRRCRALAGALALAVVLTPALPAAAQTQSVPPWLGPPETNFVSYGAGLAVEAENGFDLSVVNGEWRHHGHKHVGGTGRFASPWGEEMALRFWFNGDGSFAVEYDRNATLHYSFDELGHLSEVMAVTGAGVSTARVGDRGRRFAAGALDARDPSLLALDVAPYEALLGSIAARHSADFLDGVERLHRKLERQGGPAPAGCVGDFLQCTGAILVWAASVATIASACTAGSAFTLGAGCLAAILAHEGASAGAVGACVNAIENCREEDPLEDPGDGCNGPGDSPE